jgi:putative nucleotidyltransferase with HDIG domain
MPESTMSQTVLVSELRVGMYVHLDLGWMSHPFPLSSFKISSPEQIETIRSLGLQKLRWAPEKSDQDEEGAPSEAVVSPQEPEATTAGAPRARPRPDAKRERREQLARQRAAELQLERQYTEAGHAWRQAYELVHAEPQSAHAQTRALTQALLDKMLVEGELCIRMLNTAAGDRATAHAMNVAVVAMLMGRSIGMDGEELADLGVGALMHDIGKLELPERLRHPDEQFGAGEVQAYRQHVNLGLALAQRMGLSDGAQMVLAQHHEFADGSGFPNQLAGERIAPAARLVALVNRFDNLCNPLHGARALTPHEALSVMFAQSRSKFDLTLLNVFIRMMGVYPAGSVVQLTDDRYAVVVSVNALRPLKPRVLVHDPAVPRDEALYLDLEATPELGVRRSLRAAQLPPSALQYLAPRQQTAYFFEGTPVVATRSEERVLV